MIQFVIRENITLLFVCAKELEFRVVWIVEMKMFALGIVNSLTDILYLLVFFKVQLWNRFKLFSYLSGISNFHFGLRFLLITLTRTL